MNLTLNPPSVFPAITLALTATLLNGCSTETREPYALSYEAALDRYAGSERVADSAIAPFVAYFGHEAGDSTTEIQPSAAELYAEHLYFSDTLLTSEDKAQVVRHLESMHSATQHLEVKTLDIQQSGADIYVVWKMTATFEPARSPVTSHSLGVSHLRFNEAGQIVLQQDFWDAGAGFYEHIPVLGSIIRTINGRFYD